MVGELLSDLLRLLGKKWPGKERFQGVSFDSRKVNRGDLFFALKGEKVDGHQFLNEAFTRGAVAAIVSNTHPKDSRCIAVEDPLAALQLLAKIVQSRRSSKIIGVTGSVGKTTVKEFIYQLLSGTCTVVKTPGNANSQVGLAAAILNEPDTGDVFVAEMGMTERGHIAKLVTIAPPDIGIITKIGHSHVAYFSNGLEGIAEAKAEIFSHQKTKVGIANVQAAHFDAIRSVGVCEKQFFGAGGEFSLEKMNGELFIREKGALVGPFSLPFQASHLLENFLGAAAVVRNLGISWDEIKRQAHYLKTIVNRFEHIERNGVFFINDSYNASPESMVAALSNLPKPTRSGKTIAVLGGMVDLGSFCQTAHAKIGECALHFVDHLICYGEKTMPMRDVFAKNGKPVEYFSDFALLKERLFSFVTKGDVVLIKGSNYNGLWRLLT